MSERSAEHEVSQTTILELNVDCCEDLFEWLTLADLKTLRRTCKRLKKIVDHHIESTYPNRFGALLVLDYDKSKEIARYIGNSDSCFHQLYKHISFKYSMPRVIANVKPILSSVETVSIFANCIRLDLDLHEDFLRLCGNLKHLSIEYDWKKWLGNEWLQHQYPSLGHFSLFCPKAFPIRELQTFFEVNPNVRQFSTNVYFLTKNEMWMREALVCLEELNIHCFEDDLTNSSYRSLNTLFESGFYKRLNFYLYGEVCPTTFNWIASLNGLEKLHLFDHWVDDFVKAPMPQLKEFSANHLDSEFDGVLKLCLESMAESFMNVERIYFREARFKSIVQFIRRFAKLKLIQIEFPEDDGIFCNEGVINLPALNRQMKGFANASKVTIFVNELFYLKTKETFMRTNFDLIELKRTVSIAWEPFYTEKIRQKVLFR